ncbi:MAG: 30S ribosomal protein S1 [Bacteroidetes bacterium]|nr:30S ribosomal protein S1 [Bacteroidota bacterium]
MSEELKAELQQSVQTLEAQAPSETGTPVWQDPEDYTAEERKQLENMYSNTLSSLATHQIVHGTVIAMDDREVVVNIGFKSEGVVPLNEFRDRPDLKVGDKVEVFLETLENKNGQLVLSRRMANSMRAWDRINNALDNDEILEGIVKRRTKGGFVVDLEGVEAFLPGSQIDVKPIRDYDNYVGQKMEFKVVKINHQQNNVVISHKVLIEKDLEAQKLEIINNLEKGQVLEGTVKNITTFGAFVDLGGVDGLLHITDISWGRINNPEEVLHLDQKLNVVVLDFDDDKKRISLGLKQLQSHPWDNVVETLGTGATVTGKVVTIADYGIFIEIAPGVEGLVHVSEMSWSTHARNPHDLYKVGEMVEAKVLSVDREERKMSLGIKQLTPDPWDFVPTKYPVGSKLNVVVTNITNYGLFVELEDGVDGLIHVQDLSWNKKINHPNEFTQKGEKLEATVLEMDVENRKLRLGIKQLTEDPWETLETVFPEGSAHKGNVSKVNDKGAVIELEYGVEGFVPSKHLKVEDGKETIKEGDTVDLVVIEFSKANKRILLSHTKTWKEMEDEKPKRSGSTSGGGSGRGRKGDEMVMASGSGEKDTLGDLGALAKLKLEMDGGAPEATAPKKTSKKKAAKTEEAGEEDEA